LASIFQQLADEAIKFGMKINIPKTKLMKITKSKESTTEQLLFEGETIERIDNFKYLDSQITSDGNNDADFEERILKATTAFKRLYRRIRKRRDITLNTKFLVYSLKHSSSQLCCTGQNLGH
jgi:hypothetical protein